MACLAPIRLFCEIGQYRPSYTYTVWKENHKGIVKVMERSCTFTRPFLTFLEFDNVNVLERYCKGDMSYTFTIFNSSLSKIKGP